MLALKTELEKFDVIQRLLLDQKAKMIAIETQATNMRNYGP